MKKKHKRHNRSRSRSTERRKERRRAEPPAEDTYMEGRVKLMFLIVMLVDWIFNCYAFSNFS